MRARRRLYAAGWRPRDELVLPAVGVGSLQVGGAGKTPLAAWAAAWFVARGVRPAVLLRGYGGDEGPLHRALVPGAVVVEDADRLRGARAAMARGARVAVLDDNAQHLRVRPHRQLLLFGVEALQQTRTLLPAGPWREPWDAGCADVVVVVRKSASLGDAQRARTALERAYAGVPVAVAHLTVASWRPLRGGAPVGATALGARRLFAVCGVADPHPFVSHVRSTGDLRGSRTLPDHARYGRSRVGRIVRAAESAGVDYVVTTAKDAVKLRAVWPADAPPVLVADLAVSWDAGEEFVTSHLEACLPQPAHLPHAAARTAAGSA